MYIMEEKSQCDVIIIDEEDDDTALIDITNEKSDTNVQDDLLHIFNKCFPEPIIDLSDVKDLKGTSCSNVRCKCVDEELVAPTLSALSYFNLPNKSLLICKTCSGVANTFMQEMNDKYNQGEFLYDSSFPPTNPVVIIDSDGSDEEEDGAKKFIVPGITSEDAVTVKNAITAFVHKHLADHKVEEQLEYGKQTVDTSMDGLKGGYKTLIEDTLAASNELDKYMQRLNETFAPKIECLEPLEIPYEEMRPSVLYHQQKEKKVSKPTTNRTSLPPTELPPIGPLQRPKPLATQIFYVMKGTMFSEWIPATVIRAMSKDGQLVQGGSYLVRMESTQMSHAGNKIIIEDKEVSEYMMAYFSAPPVRLNLGTRIIAPFRNSSSNPSKYYAGLVAEPPTYNNKYRYLIFFDDGYVQYVRHYDIRVVVKAKASVSDYFTSSNNKFIKEYFSTYPEKPMLKINVMECVRVMRKGSWQNCRVIEVDSSLIRVLFLKENYEEWIYRGSPRLQPLFEHNNAPIRDVRNRLSRSRPLVGVKRPFIQYNLVSSSSDSDSDHSPAVSQSTSANEEIPEKNRRAVAKKSTNRLPNIIGRISPPQPQRRYAKRISRLQDGKIETMFPSNTIQPVLYRKHLCNPHCVVAVKYDERKTKSVNPLIVPTLFGFRRDTDMNLIFYISPCGRKLRNVNEVIKYTSQTKIPIGIDHFDFDPSVQIFNEFIVPPYHMLIKDLSHGRENVPIPVVNSINAQIPDMMEYMTTRRGLEGVHLNLDDNFLVGCDCTDNCQDKSKCSCQQMTLNEAKTWSKYFHIENPENAGYTNRRLSLGLPSGIWECNSKCKCCSKTCLNRVAQYPLKVKLQLFKTKKKGWGVRCVNDIPCGTFICVYNGNILTENNANEAGLRYGDEYFAELDYIECMEGTKANYEPTVVNEDDIVSDDDYGLSGLHVVSQKTSKKKKQKRKTNNVALSDNPDSSDSDELIRQPQSFAVDDIDVDDDDDDDDDDDKLSYTSVRELFDKNEAVYVMDAKTAGNIGRYFNHSCDPNVHVQSVFVDTHDLRFPWIAFFSQKYIRAGNELTWDYRYEPGKVPGKRLLCYCGAPNCRKRLL